MLWSTSLCETSRNAIYPRHRPSREGDTNDSPLQMVTYTMRRLCCRLIAVPAAAANVPGYYVITKQSGKTFGLISGANHNLINTATDDTLTTLSTSATGAAHLPFRLPAYGRTYANVQVSSNGNL